MDFVNKQYRRSGVKKTVVFGSFYHFPDILYTACHSAQSIERYFERVSDGDRPNPDALLSSLQREEAATRRGRLKVFLGMSPGVGKTFEMLRAARRRKAEGGDVVGRDPGGGGDVAVVDKPRRVQVD